MEAAVGDDKVGRFLVSLPLPLSKTSSVANSMRFYLLVVLQVIWTCFTMYFLVVHISKQRQKDSYDRCQLKPEGDDQLTEHVDLDERATPTLHSTEVSEDQTPEVFEKYYSGIFHAGIDVVNESCTMIMQTYKRILTLPELLTHYCKLTFLEKILILWNDVNTPIPPHLLDLSNLCKTKLQFIREKENHMTNRFKPRPEIGTECKFYVVHHMHSYNNSSAQMSGDAGISG